MNEHDSEIMAGMLEAIGLRKAEDRSKASIEIINTCSVRENADKRFFGTLGQLKHRKISDENFTVCVCGCMMQQQSVVDSIKKKYPWVDIVIGTHNIEKLPELIKKSREDRNSIIDILSDTPHIIEGLPAKRLFRHKALVNIMFGCNNFCSYCIVPYTRGREKSRKPENIIGEIEKLASDGVKEVMLLGQNVNSYSSPGGTSFPDLLRMINEIDGIERIRFMTSHPKDLSDDLISCFRDLDKLCKNIHLPVQSGSNEILKKMNRKYTREHYIENVQKLREVCPEITISTDIIVGFPGETEENFDETLDLVRNVEYDSAFTFLYSPRNGTPASRMKEQITEDIKHARFERLVEEVNRSSLKKNKLMVGRTERVIADNVSKRDESMISGRTDGFKLVNFRGDKDTIGETVEVRITESNTFSLIGDLIE